MDCSCGSLMYSLNGRVFYCPECDQVEVKKTWHDRCPVCGGELDYVDRGSASSGYSCPDCLEKVRDEAHNDPHFRMNHGRHQKRINGGYNYDRPRMTLTFITVYVVIQLLLIALLYAPITEAATEVLVQLDLRPDPSFDGVTNVMDMSTDSRDVDTTLDTWRYDLEDDFPNGTYYGTLLAGSGFEMSHEAYWWPSADDEGSTYPITGRYTWAMVSGHFNFSSRVIMNGASQWWMKVPLKTTSFESSFGMYLCVFKGCPSTDYVTFQTTTYYHYYMEALPRPSWNGSAPTDIIAYGFTGMGPGDTPEEGLSGATIANENLYLEVNSIIRPETDYVITLLFRLPPEGQMVNMWSGAEVPAGGRTRISFGDFKITDNFSTNGTNKYEVTGSYDVDFDLDLEWSFIFTQGIGHGGLFGYQFEGKWGTILYCYPHLNTSLDEDKHLSFMVPFISEDNVPMVPHVGNLLGDYGYAGGAPGAWVAPLAWTFTGSGADYPQFVWGDYDPWMTYYNYADFFLWSTNWTNDVDDATYPFDHDDMWNVRTYMRLKVTPSDTVNVTILCYDDNRPTWSWGDIDPIEVNSTKNPWTRPHLYQPGTGDEDEGSFITLAYGVYCSARGTDGEWAQVSMNDTGQKVYSYHFPNRIYLSDAEWVVQRPDGAEATSRAGESWGRAQDLWGEGRYIEAIVESLKAAGYSLWDGGASVIGYIKDGLSNLWEGMKAFGNWLWTNLLKLYEKIVSFLEDLADILVDFMDSFVYILAPLFMIAALAIVIRIGRSVLARFATVTDPGESVTIEGTDLQVTRGGEA